MASETASREKTPENDNRDKRGQLVFFSDRRSFGPLSWRVVRIASLAVLILILSGALLQLFLGYSLRNSGPAPPNAARVPS